MLSTSQLIVLEVDQLWLPQHAEIGGQEGCIDKPTNGTSASITYTTHILFK